MVTHPRIGVSPFNCNWVERGSEGCVGAFLNAICRRSRTRARVVSEADSGRCQLWKEPMDVRSNAMSIGISHILATRLGLLRALR